MVGTIPNRVAVVLPTPSARDAGLFIAAARRLPGRVAIITPKGDSEVAWPDDVKPLMLSSFSLTGVTSQWLVGLKGLLNKVSPDLVHVHGEPWSFTAQRCSGRHPVIHSAESVICDAPLAYRLRRLGYRRVLRGAGGYIAWGHTGLAAYRNAGAIGRIPTAVISGSPPDPGIFRSVPLRSDRDGLRLVFVGRIVKAKGLDDLLRSLTLVDDPHRVSLSVVGEGGHRPAAERLAERLNVDVSFLGWLDQVATHDEMAKADVLVMPSRETRRGREQWGRSVVEAMMTGRPALVSNCGELPLLVPDARWHFDQQSPHSLAERLNELLRHPYLVEAGAEQAKSWAFQHEPESLVDGLLRFWSSCR